MKKQETFIARTIGGNHVMMPVGKTAQKFSGLITANPVAAFIWNNIEKVEDADGMTKLICEEFDVEYDVALTDTEEILNQMKTAGWIE